MESIEDKVAIVGMGCTKFGELWDKSGDDLLIDATYEALEDAGIGPEDVQAAWFGTAWSGLTALNVSVPLKTQYIPVTRVENICATATEALRAAIYAIAAGACDVALAVGMEKLKDTFGVVGPQGSDIGISSMGTSGIERIHIPTVYYSMLAVRYFHRYGMSVEKGKELIARIPVKSHHNASMNPKAHFRNEITMDQVLKAPIIAYPLGLLDCCGYSDGAAAAVVTRADMAKSFRDDPISIKALSVNVGARQGFLQQDYDYTHVEANRRAAQAAYKEAGISNPLKELSMAEVHDCFSIHELVIYEDLQFCPPGGAKEYIEGGVFELDGELPVNTDGGLKCFGHPFGASGLRMIYEAYLQLQGKAGPRQVKDPQLALCHNLGGGPGQGIGSVVIFGN
ncbi:MAG: acetyl-CoA acetyltransferase [Deltaproteobacteria bacterium]|nr:MAG: acetyl-CoA acetyltransferase [Deltaproteobacteria bacterium]